MPHNASGRAPRIAALIGIAGGFLSLLLAWTLLQRQGNPAFLLFWLAAAYGVFRYTRFHRRWLASVERMRVQSGARPLFARGKEWGGEVVDVAFNDIPGASPGSGQRNMLAR